MTMHSKAHAKYLANRQSSFGFANEIRRLLVEGGFDEVLEPQECLAEGSSALVVVDALTKNRPELAGWSIRFFVNNGMLATIDGRWDETDDEFELDRKDIRKTGYNQVKIEELLKNLFEEMYGGE